MDSFLFNLSGWTTGLDYQPKADPPRAENLVDVILRTHSQIIILLCFQLNRYTLYPRQSILFPSPSRYIQSAKEEFPELAY